MGYVAILKAPNLTQARDTSAAILAPCRLSPRHEPGTIGAGSPSNGQQWETILRRGSQISLGVGSVLHPRAVDLDCSW
jgi:hypothetical protein